MIQTPDTPPRRDPLHSLMRWTASLFLITALAAANPAQAWSEKSHMTTGAIAYDDLAASDPEVLGKMEAILAAHPHYDKLVARASGLTGADRTRVMFEWLARWPDDIADTDFATPEWHYELRVVYGRTWLWPFRNGSASEGFDANFATLANPEAPAKARAIAIGWLMHIVGDIQQPLHAGHQMTTVFSATDEAGTLAFVRKNKGDQPTNLHQYWDEILDRPGPVDATSKAWAMALQKTWPRGAVTVRTYAGSAQVQFGQWLDESMHLARLVGYRGTMLKATAVADDAPVVTPRETRVVKELSKRRVATAGYRIADVLRMALK